MSTLVAIAYPDAATAEQVRQELIAATKERLLRIEDAVVVEHGPDGKIKLNQAMSTTGAGAAGGALWGGLIGLIFLAPLLGMAIGAASGALGGKMSDVGVNDDFMKELGAKLPANSAALIRSTIRSGARALAFARAAATSSAPGSNGSASATTTLISPRPLWSTRPRTTITRSSSIRAAASPDASRTKSSTRPSRSSSVANIT